MKKIISVLLIISMMIIAMPSFMYINASEPSGTAITTAEEFKNMKATGRYYLANDITVSEVYSKTFYGVLNGNGHSITIQNIKYLFTRVSGILENLTVKGSISLSSDTEAAGVALYAGSESVDTAVVTFKNVTSRVNITASGYATQTKPIGGIVAMLNKGEITFTQCKNYGNISINTSGVASGNVGGIAGKTVGSSSVTFSSCINEGALTSTQKNLQIGGMLAYFEALDYGGTEVTVSLEKCTNRGAITACSDTHMGVGGMIGCIYNKGSSKAATTIKGCKNEGKILAKGSAVSFDVGGMVGRSYAVPNLKLEDCTNSADIDASIASSWSGAGGMIGNIMTISTAWSWSNIAKSTHIVNNCMNTGTIRGLQTGGIVGAGMQLGTKDIVISFNSCVNVGNVYGNDYTGGIFGVAGLHDGRENFGNLTFNACYNAGYVKGLNASAGILGYMAGSNTATSIVTKFDSCVNTGTIKCK